MLRCAFCSALFSLCQACYRGHVYCGDACKRSGYRRTRRAANARHRRSPYLRSQRQSIAQIDDYGGDYPVCVRSGFSAAYASSIRSVDVEYFVKGEQGRPTEAQKAAKRDHIKLAARLLRSAGLAPKVSASGYRVSVKAGAR